MSDMFHAAFDFNGDLSSWDTSNVTDMSRMFESAEVFNRDISSWNTSSLTETNGMFIDTYAFNQDISSWDTSRFCLKRGSEVFCRPEGASPYQPSAARWVQMNY